MAQGKVVSEAITRLFRRSGHRCDAAKAIRGEYYVHLAEVTDLIADSGGPLSDAARTKSDECREMARTILGPVV